MMGQCDSSMALKVSISALEWMSKKKKKKKVSVTDGQAAARSESYPARSHVRH
jgi:hypothetical protein